MSLIGIENVSHAFGETEVLRNVALTIREGSYTVLLGPSGSGKTTLLSVLGGFLRPDKGRVFLNGDDITAVPPAQRPTATVFQDYALFPHMTIAGNVGFGLRMRGVSRTKRDDKIEEALSLVGLNGFGSRKPHQLSGGQRQRVALARALVIEPKALFLDEPLGALNLALRRMMQDELRATQRRVRATFVHVTHDQEEAMALADQVVVMNAGRIEDAGPPERVYAQPASRFTAAFVGESTVIEGQVIACANNKTRVETPLGIFTVLGAASDGKPVALAVRPEAIGINNGEHMTLAKGQIEDITFQGSFKRVRVRTVCDQPMLVKQPTHFGAKEGETVTLTVRQEDLILLTR